MAPPNVRDLKCNGCNEMGPTERGYNFTQCKLCNGWQHVQCLDGNITVDKIVRSANMIVRCDACNIKYPKLPTFLEEATAEHSGLQEALSISNNQCKLAYDKVHLLEDEGSDCRRKLKILQAEHSQQKIQLESLTEQLNQITVAERNLQRDYATRNQLISEYVAKIRELEHRIANSMETSTIEQARYDFENQAAAYEATIHELNNKISSYENRLESPNGQMTPNSRGRYEDGAQLQDSYNLCIENKTMLKDILDIVKITRKDVVDTKNITEKIDVNVRTCVQQGTLIQQETHSMGEHQHRGIPETPTNRGMPASPLPSTKIMPRTEMTYARAMQNSSCKPDFIRNVTLMGTSSQIDMNVKAMTADQDILGMTDIEIIRKGNNNYTVKCKDSSTAKKFHDHITAKYNNELVICSEVLKKPPMLKISGSGIEVNEDEDPEQVKEDIRIQIYQQNSWMRNMNDLEVLKVYKITNPRITYTNVICSISIEHHEAILKRGHVKLGFGTCRITEYIDLIQCQACNRYGHFRRTCNFPVNCRRCGLGHDKSECTSTNIIPNCHNCTLANQSGASYNIRHNINDDRCPVRIQRINASKEQMLKN